MTNRLKPYRVFVYGTLKEGYGNHSLLMKNTVKKVGEYVTKHSYGLAQAGFPYMIDRDYQEKHPVIGEVYESDDPEVLRDLDILEGVAHGHYRRDPIEVVNMETGDSEVVQAYIAETDGAVRYDPCETIEIDGKTIFEWA